MRRYRGRRGSSSSKAMSGPWGGSILIVFGAVALLACLIIFGIAIQQLDTQLTNAATYTEMVGLTDVMGIFGLVFFLFFMTLGLGAVGGGAYINIRRGMGGSWMDLIMLAINGGVTLVIVLIVNNTTLSQLHTTIATVNATTNYASYFTPVTSVMNIFGLVIFVTLIGVTLAQAGFAAYGGYRKIAGAF